MLFGLLLYYYYYFIFKKMFHIAGFLFGLVTGGVGLGGAVWGSTHTWPTSEMATR